MLIRPRTEDDLDACAALLEEVCARDRYPVYVPESFRDFVEVPDALAAWVAEDDGAIVGHAALRPRGSDAVQALVERLAGAPQDIGVVVRLFVSPSTRRRGLAARLLDVTVAEARGRGRMPILDVVTSHEAAIALYDALGWTCLGSVELALPGGVVEELVYRAPEPGP